MTPCSYKGTHTPEGVLVSKDRSFSLDTNINCPLKDNMSQGRNLEGALGLPFTSLSTVDLLKMGCLLRMDCLAGMLKCYSCSLLYCTSGTASFTGMNTFAALEGTWKSHLTMSSVCCSHRNCYLGWYPKSYFRGTCVYAKAFSTIHRTFSPFITLVWLKVVPTIMNNVKN